MVVAVPSTPTLPAPLSKVRARLPARGRPRGPVKATCLKVTLRFTCSSRVTGFRVRARPPWRVTG